MPVPYDIDIELLKRYKPPTSGQLTGLTVEVSIMIAIYTLTLIFTIHNIVQYIWRQRRYKNWLISLFYILSVIVLVSRIFYFSYVLNFYALIDAEKGRIVFDWKTLSFSDDS